MSPEYCSPTSQHHLERVSSSLVHHGVIKYFLQSCSKMRLFILVSRTTWRCVTCWMRKPTTRKKSQHAVVASLVCHKFDAVFFSRKGNLRSFLVVVTKKLENETFRNKRDEHIEAYWAENQKSDSCFAIWSTCDLCSFCPHLENSRLSF